MRLIVTNLLALAILLMPLQGYSALLGCGCAADGQIDHCSADADADPTEPRCCETPSAEKGGEQPVPPQPCDDEDCPSSCCTRSAAPTFVLPQYQALDGFYSVMKVVSPRVGHDRAPPHLIQLKRPPRIV